MRHIPPGLVTLVLWLSASACSIAGKGDGAMMEGTWLPVEAELGGQSFPDEILKTMKLTIRDGGYTVQVGAQTDQGTLRLEPATMPRAMDITGVEGPNQGRTFLAIYELADDTLRVCYDLAGTQRPAEFTTAKGSQQFLVRYRREKR